MANPHVLLQTSAGDIEVELFPELAPKTVEKFLDSVDAGFYSDTIFHRVIKGFMIQGGGLAANMQEKKGVGEPVPNEAASGLSNERGTIAMARTMDPHSATVQFFINTVNNGGLNHRAPTVQGYGYCAFGKVVKGMDVVDAIEGVKTGTAGMHADVPLETVRILAAKRLGADAPKAPKASAVKKAAPAKKAPAPKKAPAVKKAPAKKASPKK